ncbi:MAG: hypothetical protein JSR70_08200 [Proteobacteria bacterium]|nr:hypothetical protein [Pseudomonadota bacterium]
MARDDADENIVRFPPRRVGSADAGDLESIAARMRDTLTEDDANQVEEDPDWQALLDEKIFAKRFGFDACRVFREQVIAMKEDADLTDREIRTLRRSGNLSFQDGHLKIHPSRSEQVWGWLLTVIFSVLMLLGILAAINAKHPSWAQMGKVTCIEGVLVFLLWWTMEIYIRPTRIGKRAIRTLARHRLSESA